MNCEIVASRDLDAALDSSKAMLIGKSNKKTAKDLNRYEDI